MLKDIDFLKTAMPVVLHHHERWDGAGYPHGLAGEGIPLEARLFAVADAFDALMSVRPYKPALTYEEAAHRIVVDRGTHFDPAAVDAFLRISEAEWQQMRDLVGAGDPAAAEFAVA
jgi:HD-GYP domain-containing protein (c-di-GMP phosphodiesterase class II)